jgi:hypothetical protein
MEYRHLSFAEGQKGERKRGPASRSGGRHGARVSNSGPRKPLKTQQIASFFEFTWTQAPPRCQGRRNSAAFVDRFSQRSIFEWKAACNCGGENDPTEGFANADQCRWNEYYETNPIHKPT